MKKALLLLNMGGANYIEDIEIFLKNMFADKNILPMNRYLRKFIANIIISKRLEDVKENYRLLGGKSPLLEHTNRLITKLSDKIDMPIYPIMRYVSPFATEALIASKRSGIEELILFPLYPQYSTTTTLSSLEDIEDRCKEIGYYPKITLLNSYYDNYEYIEASCEKIIEAVKEIDTSSYDLILSAHGLPLSIIASGDPYEKEIMANVSAIKIYLMAKGIFFKNIKLAYQSKVGSSAWLEPNLADVLRKPTNLKVVIYPLAFTIDNSETVFELDIEHREIAQKIGYDDYIVVECMNDSDRFVEFISNYIKES
jgi:ferrochelatase